MTYHEVIGSATEWREIDSRVSDGIAVGLYWRSEDGAILLEVEDHKRPEQSFTARLRPGDAAYAFRHPFAWVAEQAEAMPRLEAPVFRPLQTPRAETGL
jgi:hypothetical protein